MGTTINGIDMVAISSSEGIEPSNSTAQRMARAILSLNLYWILVAVDAHIPIKYRSAIKDTLWRGNPEGVVGVWPARGRYVERVSIGTVRTV